jgi:hypothetical protein
MVTKDTTRKWGLKGKPKTFGGKSRKKGAVGLKKLVLPGGGGWWGEGATLYSNIYNILQNMTLGS